MELCQQCAQLPERQDKLPSNSQTAHLGPEKRIGESSPHYPKKYVRLCPQCGARWGVAQVSSWDWKWGRMLE